MKTLTLEQRMLEAIEKQTGIKFEQSAKACASIAIEEIRKAFRAGESYRSAIVLNIKSDLPNEEKYLSDNNLIEK